MVVRYALFFFLSFSMKSGVALVRMSSLHSLSPKTGIPFALWRLCLFCFPCIRRRLSLILPSHSTRNRPTPFPLLTPGSWTDASPAGHFRASFFFFFLAPTPPSFKELLAHPVSALPGVFPLTPSLSFHHSKVSALYAWPPSLFFVARLNGRSTDADSDFFLPSHSLYVFFFSCSSTGTNPVSCFFSLKGDA